ncbi:MAG: hypothetical protein FJ304_08380 [Planctomycetes bacterium]|nr:hypothetical protein [Planctomycetota bacterium]
MGAALFGIVIIIPLVGLIGSVIIRGGVSFANKCLPKPDPRGPRVTRYDDDDDEFGDEYDYDDWAEYDRPKGRRKPPPGAIPEPGLGHAMGITYVLAIAQAIVSFVAQAVARDIDDLAPAVMLIAIAIALQFVISAGIHAGMLPTAFGRACLVVVFECLIVVVIVIAVGAPLYVLLGK